MLKVLENVELEGLYLNIIKAIYKKPMISFILNGEKLEAFSLKSGLKQGCLPFLFNISLRVLAGAIRQGKEIKGIQTGKGEVRMSLFADNVIPHISDPKMLP